jgi:CubicO group peptidase (beta-lactamase class C family)
MTYVKIFVFLYLIISGCGIHINHAEKDPVRAVTQFLDDQVGDSDIPGIQYVIVDSTGILLEYYGGFADIKNRLLISSGTTMMAYSMTKTFTAVAVIQLAEQNILSLDDPVIKYLPEIPYGDKITIRHLLNHTSGIPNPIPLRWVHLAAKHNEYDEDLELHNILAENDELCFEPGEKYAYSNIGYWLLGKVIERSSGEPYPEYMRAHIFNRLGLTDSELSFQIPDTLNHAKGYLRKYSLFNLIKWFLIDDELIGEYEDGWLHINNHYLNGPAFGGLIGAARNIGIFLQDQLRSHSVLLSSEYKELFYTRQNDNAGDPIEMTPGWHIGELDQVRYYFKEGGGGGNHSEMRIYPSYGIGSVIMVNMTNFDSNDYLNTLDQVMITNRIIN